MNTIVDRQELTKRDLISLTIEAPQIARRIRPGQFVVLRITETGERVPLTSPTATRPAAPSPSSSRSSARARRCWRRSAWRCHQDLCGSGVPDIEKIGTVVGIGGGSGIAVLHHLLTGHRDAGNHIIGVVGARQKDLLILEDEMRALCDELIVTTDDGSYGVHGKVTDALATLVERHEHIDKVLAVGPLIMMRA
jgi:ferredoxin--NADP+ reductase